MYKVGAIINTHGVRGETKVKRTSDFAERFAVDSELFYENKSGIVKTLTVQSSRMQGEIHLLKFTGFDSMDDVIPLKGTTLYIKDAQLTELRENEYYYHEIIGCRVQTNEGDEIGIIESILSPGANDVWVVKAKDGKEHLIPYIEDVVKKVDVETKQVYITLMEGLLD